MAVSDFAVALVGSPCATMLTCMLVYRIVWRRVLRMRLRKNYSALTASATVTGKQTGKDIVFVAYEFEAVDTNGRRIKVKKNDGVGENLFKKVKEGGTVQVKYFAKDPLRFSMIEEETNKGWSCDSCPFLCFSGFTIAGMFGSLIGPAISLRRANEELWPLPFVFGAILDLLVIFGCVYWAYIEGRTCGCCEGHDGEIEVLEESA